MKFPRIVFVALASSIASLGTTNAFTPILSNVRTKSSFAGNKMINNHMISIGLSSSRSFGTKMTRSFLNDNNKRMITTTSRSMILDKLLGSFGGNSGAMGQGIVYDNLDYPGPELANAAKECKTLVVSERNPNLHIATFAGGCFWGLELAYQRVPGVAYTAVGYTQGKETEPTYNQVCAGITGHTEAVIVYYDPKECTYEQLLDTFFNRVNPTTVNGQGNDYGKQYRTGVYPHSIEQMNIATKRFELEQTKCKKTIASELKDSISFWPAEKYHQQYLEKGGQNANKAATETIRCYG